MTDMRKMLRQLFLICGILFIIGFEISAARGGRFGGARFARFSTSRYSSSSRYSGSRYSSSPWKLAVFGGVYYGSRRYVTRSRYINDEAPTICENYVKLKENGTGPWGKFVCPLGELPDTYVYCCGETRKQTCCRFFDDPGRTAGVVCGVLAFFILIGAIIFCCCRCQKKSSKKEKKKTMAQDNLTWSTNTEKSPGMEGFIFGGGAL